MADVKVPVPGGPALPRSVQLAMLSGKTCIYGEFRQGMASKFSGKNGSVYRQSKCTVLTDEGVVSVVDWLPDNVDTDAWVAPFKRGEMVLLNVRGVDEESGIRIANAKMTLVVDV
jgi:hypothetical protein